MIDEKLYKRLEKKAKKEREASGLSSMDFAKLWGYMTPEQRDWLMGRLYPKKTKKEGGTVNK